MGPWNKNEVLLSVLISTLFILVPAAGTLAAKEVATHYLPFLGLMFGAAAMSIAIQKAYLSLAFFGRDESGTIFLYSSLSLFGFGCFAILQSLSVFQLFPESDFHFYKRMELIVFFLSLIPLYLAIARYLLGPASIPGDVPRYVEQLAKIGLVVVILGNVLMCGYVALSDLGSIVTQGDQLYAEEALIAYLGGLSVTAYLPLERVPLLMTFACYTLNYSAALMLFVLFVRTRSEKNVVPVGAPFFVATQKFFYLLPLMQMVYHILGYSGQVEKGNFHLIVFCASVVFLGFSFTGRLYRSRDLRPTLISISVSLGMLFLFSLVQSDMFDGFPIIYLSLAVGTLGFASLPVHTIRGLLDKVN